jgi:hypothetical protein
MRNNVIIIAIFFLVGQNLLAQSPSWIWANGEGDTDIEGSHCVTTDAFNNVYVTGLFRNTISFGTFTLTSAGLNDIFIVKYDAVGNVIWAKSEGSIGDDFGQSILLILQVIFILQDATTVPRSPLVQLHLQM